MSKDVGVVHIGSFSKSIAPALRVGYIVAEWQLLSRMLAIKTDAGSGALEQMVLGEFCPAHFDVHVPRLTRGLRAKLETMMDALNEHFGTAAEFDDPKGGIFLWVKLPDQVDTLKLFQSALAAGVAINPGPEWSVDKSYSRSRTRLCFASPTHAEIARGLQRSPKSAVANSACRRAAPTWRGPKPTQYLRHVLDFRRRGEAMRDQLAPFLKVRRATEIVGVVPDRFPGDEQPVARWLFQRAPQLHGAAALGALEYRRGPFHAGFRIPPSMPGLISIWAISVIMCAPGCCSNAGAKSSTIVGAGSWPEERGRLYRFWSGTANPDLLGTR